MPRGSLRIEVWREVGGMFQVFVCLFVCFFICMLGWCCQTTSAQEDMGQLFHDTLETLM